MSSPIYLDNNATTALDERVLHAMLPWLQHVGNASSTHAPGCSARAAVENAREQVAALLNANRQEVVFTSGATEANNLAIKGLAFAAGSRRQIISCTTEHAAVLGPLETLRREGFDIRLLRVDSRGLVDIDELTEALTSETLLVTIMAVNNETGARAPLDRIVELAHNRGALVHTDATQLVAWGGLDTVAIPVDLASLSAHKFHGPQGVGALFVRRSIQQRVAPLADGGGHERGLRSGTLNTVGIVGTGLAAELARSEGAALTKVVAARRDRLHALLADKAGGLTLNGDADMRASGTLNVSIVGVDADALISATPSVAMSTGSACSTGVPGPSHVLSAMGISAERAESSIRLSLSRLTTDAEVDGAAVALSESIVRVRDTMSLVGAK